MAARDERKKLKRLRSQAIAGSCTTEIGKFEAKGKENSGHLGVLFAQDWKQIRTFRILRQDLGTYPIKKGANLDGSRAHLK